MAERIIKTFCARMDHGGCGLLVHLENGRVTRIEGDPESPLSRGYICAKGRAQTEKLTHPDRLLYPLLRTGERGQGKWRTISWDEALKRLTEALETTIARHGPESIAFGQGTPKGLESYLLLRLANLLRIPHVSTPGSVCHMPRETASALTAGFFPVPDLDHPPASIIAWGSNLLQTNEEGVLGVQLKRAIDRGSKLVVIDPRRTQLTAMADLWIRPKPGTDLPLALGMAKALVDGDLCDRDFVDKWVHGFDRFKDHLRDYALPRVSELTWVPEDQILAAARLYGLSKPACIQWGNALEQNHHSFQTARALLALMAMTGNLGAPGGNVEHPDPLLMKPGALVLSKSFPDKKERMMSSAFQVATMMNFVPYQLMVEAALHDDSRRIRTMYLQGTNPLSSYPDANRTYAALRRLDFLAVAEIFLTPTAQMADLVLPAASHLEFDDIGHYGLRHGFVLARPKMVDPPGACWPDLKIINELGKRMGLSEWFWEDLRTCLDDILAPSGMTYEDLVETGMLKGDWAPRGYEPSGFKTPSRKVEIYCGRLEDWGYPPLPTYQEEVQGSDPLAPSHEFPLILTSGKDAFSFHSAHRNLPSLRRLSPDPQVTVHPETARRFGLVEGAWAFIGTPQGTIRQKVGFSTDLDPRVVVASVGWWFPERRDVELSGWKESNLNILTSSDPPYDPAIGTPILRGFPCRMWSVDARDGGEEGRKVL